MPENVPDCVVCHMPIYEGCRNADGCGGNLLVIREDGTTVVRTCPNMQKLRLRRYLESIDPQLVKPGLKHDRHSPLYQPPTEKRKKLDFTKQNLLIRKIKWNAFLPHLKWVAACKGVGWFVRVVNDKTLMNIWIGNTNIKARKSQESDEDLLVANSIDDYLGGPDLVIIRLGTIVHPNKAAANVLAETLRMRSSLDKPTWLIEPEDQEFRPYTRNEFGLSEGMIVCGDSTFEYVQEHFKTLRVKTTVAVEEEAPDYYEDEDGNITLGEDGQEDEGMVVEDLPEVEEKPAKKIRVKVVEELEGSPSDDEPPVDLWSESSSAKKKKQKNWGGRS